MYSGPDPQTEVIDLSSGSDIAAIADINDTSVHVVSETIRTASTPGHMAAPSARRISAAICLTPDTPDLPSPSALLGVETTRAPRQSLLVRSPTLLHTGYTPDDTLGLLTRREALEMPSSPPELPGDDDDDDEVLAFVDERVSPPPDAYRGFRASLEGPVVLDVGSSMLGRPRAPALDSEGSALSTDVLDSSDEEGGYRRLFGPQKLARRAQSMDDEVLSISTDPSRLPSSVGAAGRVLQSEGPVDTCSSDSLSIPWLAGLASSRALLQAPGGAKRSRREREAERREERERQRALRAEERRQREQLRLVERGINGANRKKADVAELLRDMTVVADPGLGGFGQQQRETGDAQDTDEGDGSAADMHPVFGVLQQAGVTWRAESQSPVSSVRWEMRLRRKWDASLNLYVPLSHVRVSRVRSVAMVVVDCRVFTDMVAADRLAARLEIWRASLVVKRLLVVVVGLQKQMRRAATQETREFARQMRRHLKDNGGTPSRSDRPRARRQQQQQQSEAAAVSLSDEDVERALLKAHLACPWTVWTTQCADAKALGKILLQTTGDVALSEYFRRGDDNDGFVGDEEDSLPAGAGFVTEDVVSALHAVAVRSGADLADSWVKALTQIPKVTKPVARSIAALYPTPRRLFDAWDALETPEEREHMLSHILVAGAAVGGRRLGPVMSQRIFRMFNEPDPTRPFVDL